MSLHSPTHSSQMKTRGPEISLRTSRRRLPQKEQWKSSITIHSSTIVEAVPALLRLSRDVVTSQRVVAAAFFSIVLADAILHRSAFVKVLLITLEPERAVSEPESPAAALRDLGCDVRTFGFDLGFDEDDLVKTPPQILMLDARERLEM